MNRQSLTITFHINRLKKKNFFFVALILIYLFFCYLMLQITLQYIPYNTDVAFLRIKQDVIDLPFYKIVFLHMYIQQYLC